MAILGVLITIGQTWYVAGLDGVWVGVPIIMSLFVLISIIGIALVIKGRDRAGAIAVMVGTFPFAPLGLIGFFGARKYLRSFDRANRPRRRRPSQR